MVNTTAIWQHAAHAPNNYHLPATEKEPYKKAFLLTKNIEEFYGKVGKKDKKSKESRQKNKRADCKVE